MVEFAAYFDELYISTVQPTGILTNNPVAAEWLTKECDCQHRHALLLHGSFCKHVVELDDLMDKSSQQSPSELLCTLEEMGWTEPQDKVEILEEVTSEASEELRIAAKNVELGTFADTGTYEYVPRRRV